MTPGPRAEAVSSPPASLSPGQEQKPFMLRWAQPATDSGVPVPRGTKDPGSHTECCPTLLPAGVLPAHTRGCAGPCFPGGLYSQAPAHVLQWVLRTVLGRMGSWLSPSQHAALRALGWGRSGWLLLGLQPFPTLLCFLEGRQAHPPGDRAGLFPGPEGVQQKGREGGRVLVWAQGGMATARPGLRRQLGSPPGRPLLLRPGQT